MKPRVSERSSTGGSLRCGGMPPSGTRTAPLSVSITVRRTVGVPVAWRTARAGAEADRLASPTHEVQVRFFNQENREDPWCFYFKSSCSPVFQGALLRSTQGSESWCCSIHETPSALEMSAVMAWEKHVRLQCVSATTAGGVGGLALRFRLQFPDQALLLAGCVTRLRRTTGSGAFPF